MTEQPDRRADATEATQAANAAMAAGLDFDVVIAAKLIGDGISGLAG